MNEKKSSDKPPQRSKNGKHSRTILGPVPNLEEHVRPDWWRCIFNSLYIKTDGDVVDDQNITHQEVDLFSQVLQISPENVILDLCCGQGRHSMELARRGFKNVEGLDRSHYLIQKAKALAKKEGLSVKFREGDARKLPYAPDTFDVVMILGNSFGYFETMQEDLRVLKEVFRVLKPVFRVLKPWGRLLIDVTDGEYLRQHFQPRSWEWIDKKHFVCRERSLSVDSQCLISREVISHVQKGVIADQFYMERLYTKESLSELMKAAGFSEVAPHAELSPDSIRNQDLGMMERRVLITARVRKEWAALNVKPKPTMRQVAVVMGDPHKPDPLKPLSVFDDDDFYTIDQLKDALRELKEYHFLYLNNHDTLIHDLSRLAGKVDLVFNLCDEGYLNDPRKELHIPALLEKLDLPYSGAGPQSLAYCYDKSLVRGIAKEMEIPVPAAFFIKPEDTAFDLPFGLPVIVKPNFGDSSFGITQRSVAFRPDDLLHAISEIREKFGYDKPILVEEFLKGKDLSVGIIGNPPSSYTVLPITEEDYSQVPEDLPPICGYEAKWCPDSPYWKITSVPAAIPKETQNFIVECCLKLFERLECRDYARFDWRLDSEGRPKLLEVNPNPGWCWDGHLAKMAKYAGLSYMDMLVLILRAAEQRLGLQAVCQKKEEETTAMEAAGKELWANSHPPLREGN
ncbi:MAG: D-alanine--D-alanine ligase [Deltaproteobacteria bacterium RBG_13_61_14]|nr:MAG: D-alanine--D-alanine ligase [Deltaproteobacteria bacterium RBG_13_61_14]